MYDQGSTNITDKVTSVALNPYVAMRVASLLTSHNYMKFYLQNANNDVHNYKHDRTYGLYHFGPFVSKYGQKEYGLPARLLTTLSYYEMRNLSARIQKSLLYYVKTTKKVLEVPFSLDKILVDLPVAQSGAHKPSIVDKTNHKLSTKEASKVISKLQYQLNKSAHRSDHLAYVLHRLENPVKLTKNGYTIFLPNIHGLALDVGACHQGYLTDRLQAVTHKMFAKGASYAKASSLDFTNYIHNSNGKVIGEEHIPTAFNQHKMYDVWLKPSTLPRDLICLKSLPIDMTSTSAEEVSLTSDQLATLTACLFVHYITLDMRIQIKDSDVRFFNGEVPDKQARLAFKDMESIKTTLVPVVKTCLNHLNLGQSRAKSVKKAKEAKQAKQARQASKAAKAKKLFDLDYQKKMQARDAENSKYSLDDTISEAKAKDEKHDEEIMAEHQDEAYINQTVAQYNDSGIEDFEKAEEKQADEYVKNMIRHGFKPKIILPNSDSDDEAKADDNDDKSDETESNYSAELTELTKNYPVSLMYTHCLNSSRLMNLQVIILSIKSTVEVLRLFALKPT